MKFACRNCEFWSKRDYIDTARKDTKVIKVHRKSINVEANATSTSTSSSAYAGGLVGECYDTSFSNWYRFSGQTFYRKQGSSTYSTASNTLGTAQSLAELQSVSFHTATLGWSTDVWKIVEGTFPTLKNVGTVIVL